VGAYNDAVASYDARLIPAGKKLDSLKVTEGSQKKLAELPEVSSAIRDVKNIAKSTSEE
jgi:hypothetical protein